MGYDPRTRTLDNSEDVNRKIAVEKIEQANMTEEEGHLQEVKPGVASGEIEMGRTVKSISSILAFVTASGAPAAKCLLALATDYEIKNGNVNILVDQSANTLIVNYKPDSSDPQ